MDVTYTDTSLADVGVLPVSASDWAWGADENDFELTVLGDPPAIGALVYVEGGEAGGVVRGVKASTGAGYVTVKGDTWTGVLGSKVVCPDAGSAYITLSGDVRDIVAALVERSGLGGVMAVAPHLTGVSTSHTFRGSRGDASQTDTGRYMDCWAAVWQVLVEHGCCIAFSWDAASRKAVITVDAARDAYGQEAVLPACVEVEVSTPVNHLVCLGSGELADRAVAHVYLARDGSAGSVQAYTGLAEVADVYESTGDSGDDLSAAGRRKLLKLASSARKVSVTAPDGVTWRLGDRVTEDVPAVGGQVTAVISKKVVRTDGESVTADYETTVV